MRLGKYAVGYSLAPETYDSRSGASSDVKPYLFVEKQ